MPLSRRLDHGGSRSWRSAEEAVISLCYCFTRRPPALPLIPKMLQRVLSLFRTVMVWRLLRRTMFAARLRLVPKSHPSTTLPGVPSHPILTVRPITTLNEAFTVIIRISRTFRIIYSAIRYVAIINHLLIIFRTSIFFSSKRKRFV